MAANARASCKETKCKKKLQKEELRIGKVSPSPFKDGEMMINWV